MLRFALNKRFRKRSKADYQEILRFAFQRLVEKDFNEYSVNTIPDLELFRWLAQKRRIFGVIIRMFFRLSPINFRPLFSRKLPEYNPKATVILYAATLLSRRQMPEFCKYSELLEERLLLLRSKLTKNFAIKQNKELCMSLYKTTSEDVSPLITVMAGYSFLLAWRQTKDERYLGLFEGVADYFADEHPYDEFDEGIYFYYEPRTNFQVYNASAIIGAFLLGAADVIKATSCSYSSNNGGEAELPERVAKIEKYRLLGERAVKFVISCQNDDGSWFYGTPRGCRYIDNFHSILMMYAVAVAERHNIEGSRYSRERAERYYRETMLKNGHVRHFDPRFKPLNTSLIQDIDLRDILLYSLYCCFQSCDDNARKDEAVLFMELALDKMYRHGVFYSEKTWFWTNRIPYIEFQAWGIFLLSIFCVK